MGFGGDGDELKANAYDDAGWHSVYWQHLIFALHRHRACGQRHKKSSFEVGDSSGKSIISQEVEGTLCSAAGKWTKYCDDDYEIEWNAKITTLLLTDGVYLKKAIAITAAGAEKRNASEKMKTVNTNKACIQSPAPRALRYRLYAEMNRWICGWWFIISILHSLVTQLNSTQIWGHI